METEEAEKNMSAIEFTVAKVADEEPIGRIGLKQDMFENEEEFFHSYEFGQMMKYAPFMFVTGFILLIRKTQGKIGFRQLLKIKKQIRMQTKEAIRTAMKDDVIFFKE